MIQWSGGNLAEVLAYTGHKDVVLNSFGDPCCWDEQVRQYMVCEEGDWIHKFPDGHLGVFRWIGAVDR